MEVRKDKRGRELTEARMAAIKVNLAKGRAKASALKRAKTKRPEPEVIEIPLLGDEDLDLLAKITVAVYRALRGPR